MGTRSDYRIVVRAELSERYAAVFEGMEVNSGRTILTGEVIDQPHLHGIIDRAGDTAAEGVDAHDGGGPGRAAGEGAQGAGGAGRVHRGSSGAVRP